MINAEEARRRTEEKRCRIKEETFKKVQQVYSYDLIRIEEEIRKAACTPKDEVWVKVTEKVDTEGNRYYLSSLCELLHEKYGFTAYVQMGTKDTCCISWR